jgi:hypothetical protein
MVVICFRLVAILFCKFPECDTPFLLIEVMCAWCIIFFRCTVRLFRLCNMHSEMWNLLLQFGGTSSASHFYTCTLLSCVKLHFKVSYFVGIGFNTSIMLLVVVFRCWLAYNVNSVSTLFSLSIVKINIPIDSPALECTTLSTPAVAFVTFS